jgi:hypothetical protein
MQLNPEGRERLQAHLQNVLRKPCAICGNVQWQTDDTIFELRQFGVGATPNAQVTVKPVVTLTCNGCGNVLFMNALTTGVVRIEQPAQPQVIEETIVEEEE